MGRRGNNRSWGRDPSEKDPGRKEAIKDHTYQGVDHPERLPNDSFETRVQTLMDMTGTPRGEAEAITAAADEAMSQGMTEQEAARSDLLDKHLAERAVRANDSYADEQGDVLQRISRQEIDALLAGAQKRLQQPAVEDDRDRLQERLEREQAAAEERWAEAERVAAKEQERRWDEAGRSAEDEGVYKWQAPDSWTGYVAGDSVDTYGPAEWDDLLEDDGYGPEA